MPGWAARRLHDVPRIDKEGPADPDWYPLQHFFGLTAFGANVFVARQPGQELISEHDERQSGQEELYLILLGAAEFTLDGKRVEAAEGTVVAVTDPAVSRRAVALSAGTTLLALGASPTERFVSTWQPSHFENVPRAER